MFPQRPSPFHHHHPLSSSDNTKHHPKRKHLDRLLSRTTSPNYNVEYDTYVISIPNYSFGKPRVLQGSGGRMAMAFGKRLTDNRRVLVKISPYAIRLEREYYITQKLYAQPDGSRYIPQVLELVSLAQDGLSALVYSNDDDENDDTTVEDDSKSPFAEENCPILDIKCFLTFAIECCSCLQLLHANSIVHGELRPSAFRWTTPDKVKIWNFGAGLKSYEDMLLTGFGWRRAMMAAAAAATDGEMLDESVLMEKAAGTVLSPSERTRRGLQSSLAYVSPEQTGRTSYVLDHRTDLYSLGVVLFATLTGQAPFTGSPMEIIQTALSRGVPLVHSIRKDVPPVISLIIDKMTRKAVDERYSSAHGVKEDFVECLRRLEDNDRPEELVFFPLGVHDISTVFQFPSNILGRDREIEIAKAAVRRVSATHEQMLGRDHERFREDDVCSATSTSTASNTSGGHKANTSISQSSSLFDKTGCEVVVITGPGGIGKSTLMKAIHTYARQYGYLGSSKFDIKQKRPYHGLLCCLSSILRQLLTESEAVIHDFYTDLKQRLGPNFSNVRLLVDSVPELKPILDDNEPLSKYEEDMMPEISAESRFHAVFLNVIQIIIRKRSITLCLDDIHEADEPSLHLISSLISSGIKMLIILTYRDSRTLAKCIQEELEDEDNAVRVTYIRLSHLAIDAITSLVSQTLQSTPETVQPLADIIYNKTHGNPFYAKQLMMMMKRRGDIWLDWEEKEWKYRLDSISEILRRPFKLPPMSVGGRTGDLDDVLDVRHIVSHLKDIDPQAQTFLMWASLIGSVFDFQQIKWLMLSTEMFGFDDSSSDLSDSLCQDAPEPVQIPCRQMDLLEFAPTDAYLMPPDSGKSEHQAMAGLQAALQEGIIETMADDKYRFSHDRYCQAASMLIADEKEKERMHLRIGQMLMADRDTNHDKAVDVFLTADHLLKSAQLIKQFRSRSRYRQVLMKAGAEALNSGAPQMAMTYYECAMMLLSHTPWDESCPDVSYRETVDLYTRMAELHWWSNRREEASHLLDEIMEHSTDKPVDRAQAQRIQARMYFHMQDTDKGIRAIMDALKELGMTDDLPALLPPDCDNPAFQAMKEKINQVGYEALKDRGPCQSRRILTIMALLNEACTGCYWAYPELATDLAIKLVELSMDHGYGPASGNGFVWLGFAACRLGEYELGTLLGEIGLAISDKYAGNSEIARSILIHHGILAQWKNKDHYRESMKYFQQAYKYAVAGGDKVFSAMALFYISAILLHTGYNLSELQLYLKENIQECEDEEMKRDEAWILITSLLKIVMAFQGKVSVEDVSSEVSQADISARRHIRHYCFHILLLVHFDRYKEAASTGFQVAESALNHPGHHHTGVALFYHTIALIACIRDRLVDDVDLLEKYEMRARENQKILSEWAELSERNYKMFSKLVDAEMSALDGPSVESAKLYNDAIHYGKEGEWFPFLALAYQCTANYYLRWELDSIAGPMLQQSLEIYNNWGAWGKARFMCEKYEDHLSSKATMSKAVNSSTQTEGREQSPSLDSVTAILGEDEAVVSEFSHGEMYGDESFGSSEAAILSLDVVDLTSIIKSSQVISNEVNSFDELLKKMMAIIMSNSAADVGAIIIKEGVFGIAAHSSKNNCETFDPPMPLKDNNNLISTLVVHYVIHTRTILFIPNIMEDTRFATGEWFAQTSEPKSVICMPCIHKNTLVGVLYLQANLNTFTHKQLTVLSILCQVIGISITNALLFKSVQKATQANAKMIASQRKALEEARTSREQALKATKLKSNFLANMSHELRTPFSGFYGMITLLSETRLDPEQREFVTIAKQSCEMLLQIIDDLLDFSKLEAQKVKLHYGLFYLEDLIEDRIELLITLASNKNLELISFVEPDTPTMVYGDSNRIGQILMNLIGNAIKFTQQGEVIVSCGLEKDVPADLDPPLSEDEIMLKFAVQDTGIGMSQEEIKSLFLPFSQVDGSTTRNFGGTGLGLSICLGLVRLMGGDIWVESRVNEGSIFHFRVRVMKASSVAEPGVDSDRRDHEVQLLTKLLGKPRFLINTSERQANRITALVPNAVIKRIGSPEEGLDIAKQYATSDDAFHCLVVDSPSAKTMQRLLESIEADKRLRNLHVLLLYAPATEGIRQQITNGQFSRSESQQKLFNARFTRITKPVRRLRLLRTLLRVLGIEPKIASPASEPASASPAAAAPLADIDEKTSTDSADEQLSIIFPDNDAHGQGMHPHHQQQPCSSYSSSYQRNIEAFTPEELAIFQGKKILVAEDNPVAQKLIVKQLQRAGFVVEPCNNGFECIDTWKMRGPGYFLMAWIDHHMPGCDGTEATKKIRQLEKELQVERPMPIIALTADAQKTAQQSCLDAGMTDYLVKPLMQKELVAVLRRYCLTPQPVAKQSSS